MDTRLGYMVYLITWIDHMVVGTLDHYTELHCECICMRRCQAGIITKVKEGEKTIASSYNY